MAVTSGHRGSARQQVRERRANRNTSRSRECSDFLTCSFDDVPAYTLNTVRAKCGDIDLPALEKKVGVFLRTKGKELEYEHTGDEYQDVVRLVDCLKSDTDDYSYELIKRDETDEQLIIAYKESRDFIEESVYFMPVKIVSCVDDQLKDILLDFFAFLDMESPFIKPKDSMDMHFTLGIDEEDDYKLDESVASDMSDEFRKLAENYASGEINDVFEEISSRRRSYAGICNKLTQKIKDSISSYKKNGSKFYKISSDKKHDVEKLFAAIEKGITLCLSDSLFNYELDALRRTVSESLFSGYPDEVMEFFRQFLFSWSADEDDPLNEEVVKIFNEDSYNVSPTTLFDYVIIDGESNKSSNYPKQWSDWYFELLECIYE